MNTCTPEEAQQVQLRWEAHYYKTQHEKAVQREAIWRSKAERFEKKSRSYGKRIKDLIQQLRALKAKAACLQQQVFGNKTEQSQGQECDHHQEGRDGQWVEVKQNKRKRGKQPGSKGHGRKEHSDLTTVEIVCDLPDDQKRCPVCHAGVTIFPGTEDSQEIHWEVRLVRRIYKRMRYLPGCNCGILPGVITAPSVLKLIPKGMFSVEFWVHILIEKFLLQRPLYRIRKALALEGLDVSGGTLTGGMKTISAYIQPLYALILERNRQGNHWHMDETHWKVFVVVPGKSSNRWWLWVAIAKDTCCYILDPSRSRHVPKDHLPENVKGIINADRYSAYKALGKNFQIAFCWSHGRRDFYKVHDGYSKHRQWSQGWIDDIDQLFHFNAQRRAVMNDAAAFKEHDQKVREAVTDMEGGLCQELNDNSLHPVRKKVLESLKNHWQGYTLFVDRPWIPMDNNGSERSLRNPVVGRKNYYGSGSIWSGQLAAMLFTIFETMLINNIHPQKLLTAYLKACAKEGKAPADIASFLPWNMTDQQKTAWFYPRHPL